MGACYCTGACRNGGVCPASMYYEWWWPDYTTPIQPSPTITVYPPYVPTGWKCPLCGRANAPHVNTCECYRNDKIYGGLES